MKKTILCLSALLIFTFPVLCLGEDLGNLSSNPYAHESSGNPYGSGSPYKSDSLNNPYGSSLKIKGSE